MKKQTFTSLTLGSAVVLTAALAGSAMATENPFAAASLKSGYEVADAKEGKCGEGKCGGDMKKADGKCGEGKCGGDMKKSDGKCGGDKKKSDGKCGEGKCGAKG